MATRSKKEWKVPQSSSVRPDIDLKGKPVVEGRALLWSLIIILATLWVYWPSIHGDWVWDDSDIITSNVVVHDSGGLGKIWFQPESLIDYQPITFSVVWMEWQWWGNHTFAYHLLTVGIHIIDALLVWRLLSKFGLRLAWVGGLIFAIHPLAVESVAWISELKNTLSLAPFLLAICYYIDYERDEGKREYFQALGLFLLAMLCKATMVMFPVLILFYIWWKRGRIGWSDLQASGAFFAVSIALGLFMILYAPHRAIGDGGIPTGSFLAQSAVLGLTISYYFTKFFLPWELLPIYPRWEVEPPSPLQFLPWLIFGAVLYVLWLNRKSWGRQVSMGLGFFLISLVPVLGLIAMKYSTMTWSLDHMAYIPMIGLIGLTTAGLEQLEKKLSGALRYSGIGLVAVVMVLLANESRGYAGYYINGKALWTYTLQHEPQCGQAHTNLGLALANNGQKSEAIEEYERALQIDPNNAQAHYDLGNNMRQEGRTSEAIEQYEEALKIQPDLVQAHSNLGRLLQTTGRTAEAIEHYREALKLDSGNVEVHYDLGNSLKQTGQMPEAIEQFETALAIKSDFAEAHGQLGLAYAQVGRMSDAFKQCDEAVQINPTYAEGYFIRGNLELFKNDMDGADNDFTKTIQFNPQFAEAYFRRGTIRQIQGNLEQSLSDLQEGCTLAPKDSLADYARLSIWLIEVQQQEKAKADHELSASLSNGWNAAAEDWVSKVARFFLDQIKEDDLLAGAGYHSNPNQVLLCEAWYFVGMKHLGAGDRAIAIDDFRKSEATNQQNSMKFRLAQAELKSLSPY